MKRLHLILASLAIALTGANTAQAQNYPYRLTVRNHCHKTLSVAWRVKDPAGYWITRGWLKVRPGTTRSRRLRTYNRIFYTYAVSADHQSTWDGSGRPNSLRRPIVNRAFSHTSGPLFGSGHRFVTFRYRLIGSQFSGLTLTPTCG